MRLTPPTRFGKYEVRALLGSGGMGEVYLATDPVLNRPVALKIVRTDRTPDNELDRFEQEACAASALNHPNILTIYEFGEHEGTRFIAAEYVEGESLRNRLTSGSRKTGAAAGLPVIDVLDIATQVATALAAAHRAGIIHRDVKPENIAIRPDGLVKVLDFGLAKHVPRDSINAETVMTTTPGVILGTVAYVSPEQARGLAVDARGDVWSLGCVLYEMLTGHVPFEGASAIDVLSSVVGREPASLLERRPDCPPPLASIVTRMLSKERDARQQTMTEVVAELKTVRRALDSGGSRADAVSVPAAAVPARPDHDDRRTSAPSRRARALMVTAAVVLVGLVSAAWFWPRARDANPLPQPNGASVPAPPGGAAPAPVRLDFWLTVQRMRDGREYQTPFVSSGREIFESGWKFKLNASSPVASSLYVLNVGPGPTGQTTLHVLYPMRGGTATMPAGAVMTSRWYVFTDHPGPERFWLVSSTAPVPELEAVTPLVNSEDKGLVSRPEDVAAIMRLLEQHRVDEAQVTKDKDTSHTVVAAAAPVIAHLVELEHH